MSGAGPGPIIHGSPSRLALRPAPLLAALLLLAVLGCAMRQGRRSEHLPSAELADFRHERGEELLGRLDCLACHPASPAVRARLAPLPAPDLSRVGARRPASWLSDFLDAPRAFHGGVTRALMPDLLGPLPPAERRAAREELLHYLVSLGGPMVVSTEQAGQSWPADRGAELFASLGCLACHEQDFSNPGGPSGELSRGHDRASLSAFLAAPLAVRPSGRMPDMALDEDAADALACWLLARDGRRGPGEQVRVPGLRSDVYRVEEGITQLPDFDDLQPVRSLGVQIVEHEQGVLGDHYAVRLAGELFVPDTGEHAFYTSSDDGSALLIDGRLVVDNDGVHGRQRAEGTTTLQAGWHELEVRFFEASGEAWIEAGWAEDGEQDDRPFAPHELRTTALRFPPDGWRALDPEPALVERGRRRFASLGCIQCHELLDVPAELAPVPTRPPGPALDELLWLEDGCLAAEVPRGLPDYHLTQAERGALREVLLGAPALDRPLADELVVERTLARLECLSCHARDGAGGPRGALRASFLGSADLGDEGRLPPDLSQVGARLRRSALEQVLVGDERVRPYMVARMPGFGAAAVGHLPAALAAADRGALPAALADEPAGGRSGSVDERLQAGRELAGTAGLSCISCHTVLGQESLGPPGMDLAVMHRRLRPQWFQLWMREPLALRPGTRMPTFFDGERSVLGSILDGDAQAQIDALWDYLALGENLPLPTGVVVDPAAYSLVPVDQPLYVSTFMKGLSARVLSVGFPARLHVAFDLAHVRLGRAWTGPFLDAEGTWRGRAGQLEEPRGEHVLELPPGPAFALLADLDSTPWPETSGPGTSWRMLGHVRDGDGRPTFRYALGDARDSPLLRVEESLHPLLGEDGPLLVRRFAWTAAPGTPAPVLRAWVGSSPGDGIAPAPGAPGAWESSDGLAIQLRDAEGLPRRTAHGMELLVRPRAPIFEVVMRW